MYIIHYTLCTFYKKNKHFKLFLIFSQKLSQKFYKTLNFDENLNLHTFITKPVFYFQFKIIFNFLFPI